MTRYFPLSALLLCALSMFAIKPTEPEIDDVLSILESTGYTIYPFDIHELADTNSQILFSYRVYERDSLTREGQMAGLTTRTYLTPEEITRGGFHDSDLLDPATNLWKKVDKATIGFYQKPTDSTAVIMINVKSHMTLTQPVDLKSITLPGSDKPLYAYSGRPITPDSIKKGEFTPLVVYGSFWFDPEFNIFRNCGDDKDLLTNSPHYILVGFTLN